jgi:hypothetical protein
LDKKNTNPIIPNSLRLRRIEKVYSETFWGEDKTNWIIPKCLRIDDKTS